MKRGEKIAKDFCEKYCSRSSSSRISIYKDPGNSQHNTRIDQLESCLVGTKLLYNHINILTVLCMHSVYVYEVGMYVYVCCMFMYLLGGMCCDSH